MIFSWVSLQKYFLSPVISGLRSIEMNETYPYPVRIYSLKEKGYINRSIWDKVRWRHTQLRDCAEIYHSASESWRALALNALCSSTKEDSVHLPQGGWGVVRWVWRRTRDRVHSFCFQETREKAGKGSQETSHLNDLIISLLARAMLMWFIWPASLQESTPSIS